MRFDYLKVPSFNHRPWKSRPMIQVRLFNMDRTIETPPILCLIDSGADNSIFDTRIGERLGLNVKSGQKQPFRGIAPESIDGYFHRIKYQIVGDNNVYEMEAAFMESLTAGALLGQEGFFDHFTIKFERNKNKFEITPAR